VPSDDIRPDRQRTRRNKCIAIPILPAVRWVKRILVALLLIVLAATAYGIFTVRNSFPQTRGELEVAGLESSVEILRDDLGVPHIYATSQHDLFFAQGYTHAQDRFWQMDFWRHIGAGRLSEMFGESQIDADKFLRAMAWERLAEEEWEILRPTSLEILQAYADGVNAYLDTHSGSEISLEYAILPLQNSGYEIDPWTPVNTLTWYKVMAWDLRNNIDEEIARAVLGKDLSPDQLADLYPGFPGDKPVIVESPAIAGDANESVSLPGSAIAELESVGTALADLPVVLGRVKEGIGSNNWLISADLSASSAPLLANDTHLANQMPSIWYQNGLHCTGDPADCPLQLVGYSFAGTPGIITGHNGHHAWGLTNQATDSQDLYIERVNPDNPLQYEVEGEWVDFEVRTETIEVAGGDDVTYDVLTSRHGPVLSGLYLEEGEFDDSSTLDLPEAYAVALSWPGTRPSTVFETLIGVNRAGSYDEFRSALDFWDIAPQNVVYADVEGNIAYHATGDSPVRAAGDGAHPVPGWTSRYDWTGLIGTADKPSLVNPPEGYIQSANQPVLRPGEEPFIGIDAAYGYRAGRIEDMIEATGQHTLKSIKEMQLDNRDEGAVNLMPFLLALDSGGDETIAEIQAFLEGWATGNNAFQADAGSSGAAIYQAIWRQLLSATFDDQLPEDYRPSGGSRWFEVVRNLLDRPDDGWWDDLSTTAVETRDDILLRAIELADTELTDLLGDDRASWSWGELHIAPFENQTLGQSGIAPVEWLFNRTAPPRVGGSESIVNAVGWNTAESYVVDWVPSQRMVIDLADLDSSEFIHTTGQSGHAFAANYDSMLEMWTDGEYGPMPFSRGAVEELTADTLTLVPAP
jgi:penicillin amidase